MKISKVSKLQKKLLIYVYYGINQVSELLKQHYSYNSANKSMHSLVDRKKLFEVTVYHEHGFLNKVALTKEGKQYVENLLLNNRAIALLGLKILNDMIDKICKVKGTVYVRISINNRRLQVRLFDRKHKILKPSPFTLKKDELFNINGKGSIEVSINTIKIIQGRLEGESRIKKKKIYKIEIKDNELCFSREKPIESRFSFNFNGIDPHFPIKGWDWSAEVNPEKSKHKTKKDSMDKDEFYEPTDEDWIL